MDSARHRKRHAPQLGTVVLFSRSSAFIGLHVYDETLLLSFWNGKHRQTERKLSIWSLRRMAMPFRELYHWTISIHFYDGNAHRTPVILRAGTSVSDSAANNHFEAHGRLTPTDDDDDSNGVDNALALVLKARIIAWTPGAVCGSLGTRNRLSNIRASAR